VAFLGRKIATPRCSTPTIIPANQQVSRISSVRSAAAAAEIHQRQISISSFPPSNKWHLPLSNLKTVTKSD
jgi:hypothetical protein